MTPGAALLDVFTSMLLSAYAAYFVMSGFSYLIVFVALRRRLGFLHPPDRRENLRAIRTALGSILGNVLVTAPIVWAMLHGHARLYFSVADHGLVWLLASPLLVLAVTESAIYWIHRGLHVPWVYARFHRQHHAFRRPTSWVSNAFHPLDSFVQALPYHLCPFLFPLHVDVYIAMLALVMVWTVLIHDRTAVWRHPAINHTERHTIHHWYNKYNYGQFFTLWDKIGGTCRGVDTHPVSIRRTEAS